MTTTIGLLGTGRLGSAIRDAASAAPDLDLRWATGRGPVPEEGVDVAIEVSRAAAVPAHLAWAQRTGTPLVIGTTGWSPALLEGLGPQARVLVAPNFSLGVALVGRLARVLGSYAAHSPVPVDLAVTDTHHRDKADAPSGTAHLLRSALARGAGRPDGAVQTTSLRVGAVVGDHEIVVASALETITLRHSAHGRELFATGALTAARWLLGRPHPGIHTLDDLAEDHLHALLASSCEQGAPVGAPAPA